MWPYYVDFGGGGIKNGEFASFSERQTDLSLKLTAIHHDAHVTDRDETWGAV